MKVPDPADEQGAKFTLQANADSSELPHYELLLSCAQEEMDVPRARPPSWHL